MSRCKIPGCGKKRLARQLCELHYRQQEFGPHDAPIPGCRYLARDGKYYNGYMASSDWADDFNNSPMGKKMWDDLLAALQKAIDDV